jgi:carbon-monoxide dehydrogenase medium subunit
VLESGVVFEIYRPHNLREAISLLELYGPGAKLVAGGTDVMVQIPTGRIRPAVLVSLDRLSELRSLQYSSAQGLTIGALATHNDIVDSASCQQWYPALAESCRLIGSIQLRNLATLGGNIANASPSADSVPPLIAYGASVVAHGPRGPRAIALEELLTGPGTTAMQPDEVLVRVTVPPPPLHSGARYERATPRLAMDIAFVCVAVALVLEDNLEVCHDARVVLGAVAPKVIRAAQAEAVLRGKDVTPERIVEAGRVASNECTPITDVRGSAEGRRDAVAMLVRRCARGALERAREA